MALTISIARKGDGCHNRVFPWAEGGDASHHRARSAGTRSARDWPAAWLCIPRAWLCLQAAGMLVVKSANPVQCLGYICFFQRLISVNSVGKGRVLALALPA